MHLLFVRRLFIVDDVCHIQFRKGVSWRDTLSGFFCHDMALCHKVMNSITEKMQKNRPELHGDFVTYTYAFKANGKSNGSIEISYYTPYYLDENAFEFIEALGQILIFVGVISLIVAVFLGIIIAKRITTPVADVISMTKEISEGNYGERVNVNLKEREIYELAEADAITLEKTDIDIYSLAKEIMQGFKIGFEEKKIDVKLYGEETHVFADRKRAAWASAFRFQKQL